MPSLASGRADSGWIAKSLMGPPVDTRASAETYMGVTEIRRSMERSMESFQFTADDIGVGLLESITLGLYREAGDVLREYISNEIDNEPGPASVDIRIEQPNQTVLISGDGPGMDWDQFRKAVKIGVSFKDPRVNIGFRGIGIWAGVAACRELTVSTKSDSDDNEYTLIVDCDKLRT